MPWRRSQRRSVRISGARPLIWLIQVLYVAKVATHCLVAMPFVAEQAGSENGCLTDCFQAFWWRPMEPKPHLRVIAVNDVYKPERFALVRSLARKLETTGTTKLVMPGDLLGGSLFASEHRGQSMIELLNATRVDYCLLGNHEFDYGDDRLRELMDMSNFPWLGSNVREQVPEKAMFHTTMDLDVFWVRHGGVSVKVGIFGLCTPATPQLSHPSEKVIFEDLIFHAKRREKYEIQVTSPRVLCWKQNLLHCKILRFFSMPLLGSLSRNPHRISIQPHDPGKKGWHCLG